MTVKLALSALAVAAALAIGAPAFAQDNGNNAPAANPPAHHAMHHRAHHATHHAMHHATHATHHAAAHHAMHHGASANRSDSERAETRKLNQEQLHQQ